MLVAWLSIRGVERFAAKMTETQTGRSSAVAPAAMSWQMREG